MRFRRGNRSTFRFWAELHPRRFGGRVPFVLGLGCVLLLSSGVLAEDSRPRMRSLAGVELGTADFPCPKELRSRTEFWIRIFTEFDRTKKVLHDERYPWIIYEVIDVAGLDPDSASVLERERIEYYSELLHDMASLSPIDQNAAQHRVATLLQDVPEAARYTRAKERLRTQTGIRDSFRAGLERSGRYLAYIHQVLERYGVPGEIAFLPHVESSFNPTVRSRAGAVGLWQFTRDTGRVFMRVEANVDERRDPYASSVAAARYLGNSRERLGSWPLAVVSYNYGLAGVRRAMERLGTDDIVRVLDEYDGPRFGFASQNFYCEFLAAIEVGRNPNRYFADLEIEPPAMPQEFVLQHHVKFNALCMGFGLPTDEMTRWNPALGRSFSDGERAVPKDFVLRLPVEVGDAEDLYAGIPSEELHAKPLRGRGHKVVAGETLGKIARRYRVSLAELRGINGLESSDRIYPGQVLALP